MPVTSYAYLRKGLTQLINKDNPIINGSDKTLLENIISSIDKYYKLKNNKEVGLLFERVHNLIKTYTIDAEIYYNLGKSFDEIKLFPKPDTLHAIQLGIKIYNNNSINHKVNWAIDKDDFLKNYNRRGELNFVSKKSISFINSEQLINRCFLVVRRLGKTLTSDAKPHNTIDSKFEKEGLKLEYHSGVNCDEHIFVSGKVRLFEAYYEENLEDKISCTSPKKAITNRFSYLESWAVLAFTNGNWVKRIKQYSDDLLPKKIK